MDVLLDEIESLEAILMEDVKITRNEVTDIPEVIETTVLPTVGEDVERQYVSVTLQVMPTMGYPDESPQFKLKNPRGLDDHGINAIENSIKAKLKESIGLPVVFDLIEVVREHLTSSNMPSGQCVVCLYGFQEGDEFTKTECYHFLHSYCLARHIIASRKNYQEEQDKLPIWQQKLSKPYQAVCPVCREQISDEIEPLKNANPPRELENAPKFELTNELKYLQNKMANLFLRQKERGGIIDLDAAIEVIALENDNRDNELGNEGKSGIDDVDGPVTVLEPAAATTQIQQTSQHHNINSRHHYNHRQAQNQYHHHHHHNNHHNHGYHHHHRGNHNNRPNNPQNNPHQSAETQQFVNQQNNNTNNTSNNGSNNSSNSNNQGGYPNRHYNRNRRGVHPHHGHTQNNTQQPCSSNPR